MTLQRGKRKGLTIDLDKRRRVALPKGNGVGKYSAQPHPLMRLSRLALPPEAGSKFVKEAVSNFSTSVTVHTQTSYASAARAYIEAEGSLGRPFSSPPTEAELAFLITFLIKKKLEPATIRILHIWC